MSKTDERKVLKQAATDALAALTEQEAVAVIRKWAKAQKYDCEVTTVTPKK